MNKQIVRSRKQLQKKDVNISPTALIYRGPTQMPKAKQEDDTWVTQINIINAVASTAGGVINTVFTPASQIQSSSDWASLAALWNEFRILSVRVQLIPWNKYNLPSTTIAAPVYSVIDRSTTTALASLSSVANYNSAEQHEPSTKIVRVAKMEDVEEAIWTSTSTAPANDTQFHVKLYSAGNSNSTIYYDYFNSYMVQFRGRI